MAIISILSACVCIAYIKKTNIMNELLYVTFSFIMVLYLIAIGTNGNLFFLKALKISSTIFFIFVSKTNCHHISQRDFQEYSQYNILIL